MLPNGSMTPCSRTIFAVYMISVHMALQAIDLA
jgi:hypothetical protein